MFVLVGGVFDELRCCDLNDNEEEFAGSVSKIIVGVLVGFNVEDVDSYEDVENTDKSELNVGMFVEVHEDNAEEDFANVQHGVA